jgi:hypothetical protein
VVRPLAGPVTGEVVISRPVQVVYGFYRDFTNLPRVLGDVVAVEQVTGMTYRWIVAGPLGTRLPMTVTVTDQCVNELIRYQTGGPGRCAVGGSWPLPSTRAPVAPECGSSSWCRWVPSDALCWP